MQETIRPLWLCRLLAFLVGFWVFILSMTLGLAVVIHLIDAVLPGDGIPAVPGLAVLLVCLVVAVWSTVRLVKWQEAVLARRSLRVSYAVLVALVLLTLGFFPAPFTMLSLE
jgi:hypothetical protein